VFPPCSYCRCACSYCRYAAKISGAMAKCRASPVRQNRLHPIGNLLSGEKAIRARCEHRIILSVSMTDRGGYSGRERALIQIPPCQISSRSSAVPGGRVRCGCRRFKARTAGGRTFPFPPRCGQSVRGLDSGASRPPWSSRAPGGLPALFFSFFKGRLLFQTALPLVTPAQHRQPEVAQGRQSRAHSRHSGCSASIKRKLPFAS
jgi:hypothetical protein